MKRNPLIRIEEEVEEWVRDQVAGLSPKEELLSIAVVAAALLLVVILKAAL